jgi:hypothetical protein
MLKWSNISLLIFLVLCLKGIKFTFAVILFTVRNLASWAERPLTIRVVQEELKRALSVNILSVALFEEILILVAKFIMCNKLFVFSKEFACFFCLFLFIVYVYVSIDYKLRLWIVQIF